MSKSDLSARKKIFWYFFYHQWSKMSCFKKPSKNFFSSRKVTFGHFFEKVFCPRWQVENSTLTLKFWALRSKRVKRSFRARITLVITSDTGLSVPVWLIMMTSSMSSQTCGNLLKFSVCFFDFSRLQVNLWPQPYHQNDRKKTENLLIYNSKKMLIFDQKILEVAITINVRGCQINQKL